MAKSLRSRQMRKIRALKRERYATKEVARLKTTVAKAAERMMEDPEVQQMVTVTDAKEVAAKQKGAKKMDQGGEEKMEDDSAKPTYNPRTMKDEHGHYPVWMNTKQIKRLRVKNKKKSTKKGNKERKKF